MNETKKKALEKYGEKVAKMSIRIDKEVQQEMLTYCKDLNITQKQFIENAIKFYIDNH